jgi:hypothetical protein
VNYLSAQLVSVLEDVCRTVEEERGIEIDPRVREHVASVIMHSWEMGVTDPLALKEEALKAVRGLWAPSA